MSDWDRAFHAYGPARGGDELLDVLRRGEEIAYADQQPYTFRWSGLYCDGRITPATVLGLRHLTPAVLADDFGGADPTLRRAAARVDCFDFLPQCFAPVWSLLSPAQPERLRDAAAQAAAASPRPGGRRPRPGLARRPAGGGRLRPDRAARGPRGVASGG